MSDRAQKATGDNRINPAWFATLAPQVATVSAYLARFAPAKTPTEVVTMAAVITILLRPVDTVLIKAIELEAIKDLNARFYEVLNLWIAAEENQGSKVLLWDRLRPIFTEDIP